MCFLSLGPRPGGSYSCLDMVNSADVNASRARPRAPLGKLVSDTENKFAFFSLPGNSATLCSTEMLRCFLWALCRRQAEQAPVTKFLEGDLCFCSLFSFKIQSAKFVFPGPKLKRWQARTFLQLLGNSLANGHFKWKTVPIWNFSVWAKMLVKTLNFNISFPSLLQLSLLRAGSLHGKGARFPVWLCFPLPCMRG